MVVHHSWEISPSIGKVSGITLENNSVQNHMILAHGAGAGMQHPFMESIAQALLELGVATTRFNFAYMENGKRRPDLPQVAHKTIEKIVMAVAGTISIPLFLGGKSFGGRMSSQWIAKSNYPIRGLVFYGFPLHPPGKIGIERADHLSQIKAPMLFLQGAKDKLAQEELIRSVTEDLATASLIVYPDADHSFKVPKRSGISQDQMVHLLADDTKKWMKLRG